MAHTSASNADRSTLRNSPMSIATVSRTRAPTSWLDGCKALLRGGIFGAIIFLGFVLVVGAVSFYSDRSLIDQKIRSAIHDQTIQIPGRWDITNPQGVDTFSDCEVLQSLRLSFDGFFTNLFDTRIYVPLVGMEHSC